MPYKNIEDLKAYKKIWVLENKEKIKIQKRKWQKEKNQTDLEFKLKNIVRSRIQKGLRNKVKRSHEYLGCTIEFYKEYLQKQFDENMSWENYGSYWHIDHIIPLASFDLTNEEEQMRAFHYTNTQPLEAKENLRKGYRIP